MQDTLIGVLIIIAPAILASLLGYAALGEWLSWAILGRVTAGWLVLLAVILISDIGG